MEVHKEIGEPRILRRGNSQKCMFRGKWLLAPGCDLATPKTVYSFEVIMIHCYQTAELPKQTPCLLIPWSPQDLF